MNIMSSPTNVYTCLNFVHSFSNVKLKYSLSLEKRSDQWFWHYVHYLSIPPYTISYTNSSQRRLAEKALALKLNIFLGIMHMKIMSSPTNVNTCLNFVHSFSNVKLKYSLSLEKRSDQWFWHYVHYLSIPPYTISYTNSSQRRLAEKALALKLNIFLFFIFHVTFLNFVTFLTFKFLLKGF